MNWGRNSAALGLSVGLHLAGVGLLRGRLPSPRLAGETAPNSEVPLTILGSGASLLPGWTTMKSSDRRSTGAGRARGGRITPVTTVMNDLGSPLPASREVSLVAATGVESPVHGTEAVAEAGPGLSEGALSGGSEEGVSAAPGRTGSSGSGFGLAPAIDLEPFVERLRRSAEQCGSVPPRGRGDHRAHAPVALVRFCVAPDGTPTAVSLVESTGDRALDRAALECIVPGAAPLPRADYCLVVPLRFH